MLGRGALVFESLQDQKFDLKCGVHTPLDSGDKEVNHTNIYKTKNFVTNRK